MSSLLSIEHLSQSHGALPLFENLSFTIKEGDHIGLIGPNGSGKTSLIKILAGIEPPYEGSISKRQNLSIGYASQSPDFPPLTIEEVLLQEQGPFDEHERETKAHILLGKAQFTNPLQLASTLSGGWKKRLDIVRTLMSDPELLLLDEPTNHLDLEGIEWLEKLLRQERRTFIIVSHDRYFLESITNRTIEINRCYPDGLFAADGPLSTFCELKGTFLRGQKERERSLNSKLRTELEWLKRSPKARTTKSRARVEKTLEMQHELKILEKQNKTTKIDIGFSE